MTTDAVNLAAKFALFDEHWSPKTVAMLNDYEVKLVKVAGEFAWHQHDDTDELFLVIEGEPVIRLADRPEVTLSAGELFVVPKGLRHQPFAAAECRIVLLEPAGVVNTGDAGGPLTARSAQL